MEKGIKMAVYPVKNKVYQTVLDVVKYALFDVPFDMERVDDWPEVYAEMKRQTIVGLLWKAEEKIPRHDDEKEKWKREKYQIISKNLRLLKVQDQTLELLQAAEIQAVIIKGAAAAVYYPDPVIRMMGDIDILVESGRHDDAVSLLRENGYQIMSQSGRHTELLKDGVEVEVHVGSLQLLDESRRSEFDALIYGGFACKQYAAIEGHRFPMLSTTHNGLVLLNHMQYHIGAGMGLRQVIDWMEYVYANLDDGTWENGFGELADEFGLKSLAVVATKTCKLYLGLPEEMAAWCDGGEEKYCQLLVEDILDCGNFGRKKTVSRRIRNYLSRGYGAKDIVNSLQAQGKNNWAAAKKNKAAHSFAWLYQGCAYLKRALVEEKDVRGLLLAFSKGKQRKALMRTLGIQKEK